MNSAPTIHTKSNQAGSWPCWDVAQYPDRVFVGGFCEFTTETDLAEFFEQYVQVRDAKIFRTDENKRGFGFITVGNAEQADRIRHLPPDKLVYRGNILNVGPARRKVPRYSEGYGYACVTPNDYYPPGTYMFNPYKAPHFLRRPMTEFSGKSRQIPSQGLENDTASASKFPNTDNEELERKRDIREPNNNAFAVKTRQLPPSAFPYPFMQMPPYPPGSVLSPLSSTNIARTPQPTAEHLGPPGFLPPDVYKQIRHMQLAGGDRLSSFNPFRLSYPNMNPPETVTKPGSYSRHPDQQRKISPESSGSKAHKKNKNDSRGSDIHASGDGHHPKGKKKPYNHSNKSQDDIKAEFVCKKVDELLKSELDDSDDVFLNK